MNNPPSILVAEDERMLRDMLAQELAEAGAAVDVAADGQEALERIERKQPDLLLLDILMPRKDGYQVLQQLQKKKAGFPIVMLTNISSPDEEQKCREMGAVDFIVKSNLDVSDLWEKIGKYLP